jgi:hypothetical protein
MAKYCVTCGKTLPDGVEICPSCSTPATESDAALFTRITADTEVWKEPEDKRKKPRRRRSRTQRVKTGVCRDGPARAGISALLCDPLHAAGAARAARHPQRRV